MNNKRAWDDTSDQEPSPNLSKRHKPDNDYDYYNRYTQPQERPQVKLSRHNYTVGWLCALPIEMAAATAMLDSVHQSLPCSPLDTNAYELGSIGIHNIVIACLPSGKYGTNNAANVANHMARSFPSIRIRLMVGIGGGVPGKVDVRLGDVVVSSRVVQYDIGKTLSDGRFQRTGIPYQPPNILSSIVSRIRATHQSTPSKIPTILSSMLRRHPAMTRYTRHDHLQDRLFDSTYDHVESWEGCMRCDRSKLLERPVRDTNDPKIHYGVVASGNQVIKHAKARDQLAQDFDAICIEMEAAGLMDNFPCLVIRGICDYSDSHKHKNWQEYAAATAAAYATELLAFTIPATEGQIITAASDTERKSLQRRRKRRKALLDSLRFEQIESRCSSIKVAHNKTCEWLLRHPDYIAWLDPVKSDDHHGFLWISGKPGAGKSTLMKFAYTHAKRATGEDTVIASFFFNARGNELEKSAIGMHRSLLLQLLKKVPDLQEVLDDAPTNQPDLQEVLDDVPTKDEDRIVWDIELLRTMFSRAVGKFGPRRLLCFIDALDECDEDQGREMIEYFEDLEEHAAETGTKLYICFSSRHYPCVSIKYGRKLILEDQTGHGEGLERYVQTRLKAGAGPLVEGVRSQILEKAAGVFMWAVLVIDILNKEFNSGRIFAVNQRLKEIPLQLSELFKDILRRDSQNVADLLLCLQWVLYAKRPLGREEFYFAVVSGLSEDPKDLAEWNPDHITTDHMSAFVQASSKGLAEVTKHGTVQFIHESVRDFLVKDNGLGELWTELGHDFQSISHERLKQCCYTYITLNSPCSVPTSEALPKTASRPGGYLRQLTAKLPFLEYATRQVLYHADAAANSVPQDDFLIAFPVEGWIRLDNLFARHEYGHYTHTHTASLLYLLAENNWASLIRNLLPFVPNIDISGERYRYPLFAAMFHGHQEAANAILQRETNTLQDNLEAQLEHGRGYLAPKQYTPLSWAAGHGHKDIVQLLVKTGKVEFDLQDETGQTPLSWAARSGHNQIIQFLFGTGKTEVGCKDQGGQTPLSWAAQGGHKEVVQLLLKIGKVEVDSKDLGGQTPLSWAARGGHREVVQLLLETGKVELDSQDTKGRTPLSWAALGGHREVVQLLLGIGRVDMDSQDERGQTPLLLAVERGHTAIVQLLLETGKVEVDLKDQGGQTLLSLAAEYGYEEVVQLLLETEEVDIDSGDQRGRTPLFWAAERGHNGVVQLLLQTGKVDVDFKDLGGQTPLSVAAERGHKGVVRLLLETGKVEVDCKDIRGQTPFSWAAGRRHTEVVQMLLQGGSRQVYKDLRASTGRIIW